MRAFVTVVGHGEALSMFRCKGSQLAIKIASANEYPPI